MKEKSIKRHNKKSLSYKVTKEQVKYTIKLLKKNEQITLKELSELIKKNIIKLYKKSKKNHIYFTIDYTQIFTL